MRAAVVAITGVLAPLVVDTPFPTSTRKGGCRRRVVQVTEPTTRLDWVAQGAVGRHPPYREVGESASGQFTAPYHQRSFGHCFLSCLTRCRPSHVRALRARSTTATPPPPRFGRHRTYPPPIILVEARRWSARGRSHFTAARSTGRHPALPLRYCHGYGRTIATASNLGIRPVLIWSSPPEMRSGCTPRTSRSPPGRAGAHQEA